MLHTLIVSISIDYGNLLVVLINNAIRSLDAPVKYFLFSIFFAENKKHVVSS